MAHLQLSQTLADSFTALADEVQSLTDRKTVLEHKLRFAHEQFQYLADKYAPAAPEIADTLVKLQLPPHTSVDSAASVPLPLRASPPSQHEIALVIRDGRRAASRLASLGDASKTTSSSRDTFARTSDLDDSSMSTALEQDFTVQGKRGNLQCPFSKNATAHTNNGSAVEGSRSGVAESEDPICAALNGDGSATGPGKCPIRFLDKHSPEEVARYVEMHKHDLPRSHEVCLRRYQGNEDQIRKLDSKYGNMISMIEDLGQLHQPMLPEDEHYVEETDGASNERVENWAHAISTSSDAGDPHGTDSLEADAERQSHFDRPLKEVRVGESPSRPWGISVPVYDTDGPAEILSPPPAPPVRMPEPPHPIGPGMEGRKCPFDHTKLTVMANAKTEVDQTPKPEAAGRTGLREAPPVTPMKEAGPRLNTMPSQPVFMSSEAAKPGMSGMVFNGPVFIGYPMEEAMRFMNQFQRNQ